MNFFELIRSRYSVRAYSSLPVEEEKLAMILEAGRLAPSAANRQPVQIMVIHTAGRTGELALIYGEEWFVQPPIILAVCGLPRQAWNRRRSDGKSYLDVDAAIVMDHLILAAAALGLGTCWVAAFNPTAARQVLELPDEVEPLLFTPLGYPADQPGKKTRKDLANLVRYERW
ncbi:MAG TPA: nitroreductase family protein [Levilinea sp.]|nr:nitroreductase family protein [Levilinea sp.]